MGRQLRSKVAERESAPELASGARIDPLCSLLQSAALAPQEKGHLRSVVAGGQGPQHRQWDSNV
eukprot:7725392-Pyramimonas_sp.AAC.1